LTKDVWTRLGMNPNDKSTWTKERINMPSHQTVRTKEFAPHAWGAICELLGGEERVNQDSGYWNDGFIVNLGSPEWEDKKQDPKALDNWHVDGDFFIHFLDSPEQGLLVIPIFTDIVKDGGGTMICPEAMGKIARFLHDHPEGVTPYMKPRNNPHGHVGLEFYQDLISSCNDFHEMTGNIGDVILLHPLMLHSASHNRLRRPRIITNPPVSILEPFKFDRANAKEFSVVELKTMKEVGEDKIRFWKATAPREHVIPERLKVQSKMKEEELARLRNESTKPQVTVRA